MDLYVILALGTVQSQFGTTITVYRSATGSNALSGADLASILVNRIGSGPANEPLQELKGWMALLSSWVPVWAATSVPYLPLLRRSPNPAVSMLPCERGTLLTRSQAIAQLASMTPVIAALTNASYGDRQWMMSVRTPAAELPPEPQ